MSRLQLLPTQTSCSLQRRLVRHVAHFSAVYEGWVGNWFNAELSPTGTYIPGGGAS